MRRSIVTVEDLLAHFKYEVIFATETALKRKITTPETNHPGLELVGFYDDIDHHQGIILGSKEIKFIKTLSKEQRNASFDILTHDDTPFILITRSLPCPDELKDLAIKKQIAILRTSSSATITSIEVMLFIYEKLSEKKLIHGTLVEIYGDGVLIMGDSGIGKSEIALELIKKGHRFVADDGVLVNRLQNHVFGQPSEHLKNLLEVRGLGLIDVYAMYGVTSVKEYCEIRYIINLTSFDNIKTNNRLQSNISFESIKDVSLPKITLPVTSGRSMANLIEVAVISLRLQSLGINPTTDLMNKYDKILKGGDYNE